MDFEEIGFNGRSFLDKIAISFEYFVGVVFAVYVYERSWSMVGISNKYVLQIFLNAKYSLNFT